LRGNHRQSLVRIEKRGAHKASNTSIKRTHRRGNETGIGYILKDKEERRRQRGVEEL